MQEREIRTAILDLAEVQAKQTASEEELKPTMMPTKIALSHLRKYK